jgi:hypothetical protein
MARAALIQQPLGEPDIDVPAGRERPGLVRQVAGVHQDGEAPVEDSCFVDSLALLLDRGHGSTLRRV